MSTTKLPLCGMIKVLLLLLLLFYSFKKIIDNSHVAGYDTAMGNFIQGNITTAVSVEDVFLWYPWRGHQVARGDR